MKFIKLLPLMGVATVTSTIIPLVSCTDNKYELVQIDLNNIEDIVGMKNVEFLQDEELVYGQGGSEWAKEWMSPTVYHGLATGDIEVYDRFLWHDNDIIMETERDPSHSWQWKEPEPATMHQFRTPDMVGQGFISYCFILKTQGIELTFDKEKLCYSATFSIEGESHTFEFYFLDNKLIKFVETFEEETTGIWGVTIFHLSYSETTPVPPFEPSLY